MLLDPRSDGFDGMGERIGKDPVKGRMLRQPLKIAASRENEPRFTLAVLLEKLGRSEPSGARTFALYDPRLPFPLCASREKEERVEAANGVKFRNPPCKGRIVPVG